MSYVLWIAMIALFAMLLLVVNNPHWARLLLKEYTRRLRKACYRCGDFTIRQGVLEDYYGDDSIVVIPEGVISIGSSAFSDCLSLSKVILPAQMNGAMFREAFHISITKTRITVIKKALVAQIPNNVLGSGKKYL